MARPPNILWLFSDQHRADVIGAAGHPIVRTPNLDALAAEGALFDSAYCQGPLCRPARTSLLTGRYVRDHGVRNNETTPAGGLRTVVDAVRDAGYQALAIGKPQLYPHQPAGYTDARIGATTASWITTADRERPFFLWVGFPGPGDPRNAPDGHLDSKLTDERISEVSQRYFGGVTALDTAIGAILDAMRQRELDRDTWIIYSSDHGEMLGAHGLLAARVFYEAAVKVPLIIRPPGGAPARRFTDLIEHVDLSATLLDIVGTRPVPGAPGRTLADIAEGSRGTGRTVVISEILGFGMWRTERYKLIVREAQERPVQLFDLAEDPDEDHNLVADPSYGDVIADLMHDHVHRFLASAPFRPI